MVAVLCWISVNWYFVEYTPLRVYGNYTAVTADALARYELSGAGYEEFTRLVENVRKVTPEEIQKVWSEYAHNLQFVILGSPGTLRLTPFLY